MLIHTVSKPGHEAELAACLESFRRNVVGPMPRWIIETEKINVSELKARFPAEQIVPFAPDVDAIETGYCRQMAAKFAAARHAKEGETLLFVDDDVLAVGPWEESTFKVGNAVIVGFRQSAMGPWAAVHVALFGKQQRREWVVGLPFAFPADALRKLYSSGFGMRARSLWLAGAKWLSEFTVMGEWAFNEPTVSGVTVSFRDVDNSGHWSGFFGTEPFQDFARQRRRLRQNLASEAPRE